MATNPTELLNEATAIKTETEIGGITAQRLGKWLEDNVNIFSGLINGLSDVINSASQVISSLINSLSAVATSGSYNDLTDTPDFSIDYQEYKDDNGSDINIVGTNRKGLHSVKILNNNSINININQIAPNIDNTIIINNYSGGDVDLRFADVEDTSIFVPTELQQQGYITLPNKGYCRVDYIRTSNGSLVLTYTNPLIGT